MAGEKSKMKTREQSCGTADSCLALLAPLEARVEKKKKKRRKYGYEEIKRKRKETWFWEAKKKKSQEHSREVC